MIALCNQKMRKPNLFIVGHPKSGTTALYYFLRQHPQIFMPVRKEPWFFCKDLIEESDNFYGKKHFFLDDYSRYLDSYLDLFKKALNEKIVGEASTNYLYSRVAAKEIHRFNPEAKIVAILREPVDYNYAYYAHLLRNGYENISFERSTALEEQRKNGEKLPKTLRFLGQIYYSERVKYAEQVKRYLDLFGEEQVKIMIYEDYQADNENAYKDILDFLEVDTDFVPSFEEIHTQKLPKSATLNKYIRNSFLVRPLRKIFPRNWWYVITTGIEKFLWKHQPRPELDPQLRRKLMQQYKPEVEKTSDLLGIDLVKKWGYDNI